jgi:hypothetical protein
LSEIRKHKVAVVGHCQCVVGPVVRV